MRHAPLPAPVDASNALSREPAAFQELLFRRYGISIHHVVSMRKSPESYDDIAVHYRESQLLRITKSFVELQTAVLIRKRLGMHERQIEELL